MVAGAIAFLFPGQGSQEVGMGRALALASKAAGAVWAEADAALGFPLSRLCFEGPAEELGLTANTQPAVLTASVAAAAALAERGVVPELAAGHSLGEYSANVAAGTMAFADAVTIVRRRGQYMQEAVPVGAGAMAAILGLDVDGVARACAQAQEELPGRVVTPANVNAPGQIVIAGHADAVARAGECARGLGARRAIPLAVSAPFHCPLMKPAEERLAVDLRALATRDPRIPVVANVDAAPKRDGAAAVEALIAQVSAPVQWEAVVTRLVAEGARTFVELGPGTVLAGLIRKIDRSVTVMSVENEDGLAALDALPRGANAAPQDPSRSV